MLKTDNVPYNSAITYCAVIWFGAPGRLVIIEINSMAQLFKTNDVVS